MKGTERGLIDRSIAGDQDAYRQIVENHANAVFRLAFRIVGHEQDAEEVVQETFLRAYRGISRFDGKSQLGTWLYSITTRTAFDLLRSRKRQPTETLAFEVAQDGASQEERMYHSQINGEIKRELACLAPKERGAFVLRHFQECSIAEISEILGIGQSAVKHAIFRAVRKLRMRLIPQAESET